MFCKSLKKQKKLCIDDTSSALWKEEFREKRNSKELRFSDMKLSKNYLG